MESVSVFGHSLGGAIADLMSFSIQNLLKELGVWDDVAVRLIRVGAPKAGDRSFAHAIAKVFDFFHPGKSRHLSLTIVHPDDIVPLGTVGPVTLQKDEYLPTPGYFLVVPVADHDADPHHHRIRSYEQSVYNFFSPFMSALGKSMHPDPIVEVSSSSQF